MATTSDLRTGMVIRYNGELHQVVEWQHVSPGNWRAFVRLKLKNMKNGKVIEDRVRAGSDIDVIRIEHRTMQYLYRDGQDYIFMDNETFDQFTVPETVIGDAARFLKENENAELVFNATEDRLLAVELPIFVRLQVIETTTAVRGDTATDVTKTAKLETGAVVNVPGFIEEGETIKIDTRSGNYLGRGTQE